MTTNKILFIDETHAQVTKAFYKQARIFGTPEYKLWRAYLADFPNTTVDHIDGNKQNNTAANLRWLSFADNVREYFERKKHDEQS